MHIFKIQPKKQRIRIDFGIEYWGHIVDNALTYNLCNDKKVKAVLNSYNQLFSEIQTLKQLRTRSTISSVCNSSNQ